VEVHAEDAKGTELLREFAGRQATVLEPVPDVRAQPVVGELAHGVAQQAVLVAQIVVEVEQVQAIQGIGHDREITPGRYPALVPQPPSPLGFDPIDRAGELWERHWPDQDPEVYASMRAVTSIMRAHQILIAELDAMLRPFGITFSRYEALVLLTYSRHGSLPLSVIGERLQVHATSVTNVIDRLEGAGLVNRVPNPLDGRGTLAVITDSGREVARKATEAFNAARFGTSALDLAELRDLFEVLRRLRRDAGDFVD
jgi:DNA-binding MarR family transcriptional regulator